MRNQIIQNAVVIEYPDYITHINDRNIIKVYSLTSDPVAAVITLSCNGDSVQLEYNSELSNLVFHINSSLNRIVSGQHQTVTINGNVANDDISYEIDQIAMVVEQGRTLNGRPHGCCRTMYWQNDDDLEKVEIFVPVRGTATVGEYAYSLQAGCNSINLTEHNGSPVTPPSGDFKIHILLSYSHSDTPVFFGDLWKHASDDVTENSQYDIQMVYISAGSDCAADNYISFGKIMFLDTDGCWKRFIGRVTNMKYSLKQSEYISSTIVVNNPMSMITDTQQEVTMKFADVEHNAYIHDIVFSPSILYLNGYGEWKNCLIADSNLSEKSGEKNDVEIKLKVLA